jgi:hypothetical protein
MMSEGTLALLSACRYLLQDKALAIARDQIRLSIGCLKALGEVWPRTAKNVKEIQTIARHVLVTKGGTASDPTPSSSGPSSLTVSDGQTSTEAFSPRWGHWRIFVDGSIWAQSSMLMLG